MKLEPLLFIFGFCSNAASLPFLDWLVNTPSGPIRGITSYVLSHPVQTFLGIPFAKPPVGELRFRKPEPVEGWTRILNAISQPPACVQYTTYPFPWYDFKSVKSEDCLYLNIWAPIDARTGSKKAVMFWIYGGGPFGSNSMNVYDGRALAGLGDVILVSPNFRLGLFGFLTSGTSELPGNNGIWDLLAALRWVRINIEALGGDPNKITLHGESSGAFIVSMFCVSPLTKDLFSKAILQSGTAIFLQTNPAELNQHVSQHLATAAGCASDHNTIQNDTQRVVDCLREKDALYLAKLVNSFNPASDLDFLPQYGDELFPNPPYEAIKQGRFHPIPLLIGDNEDEGVNQVTSHPDVFGFFGEKYPPINKTYGKILIQDTYSGFLNCSEEGVVSHYFGGLADDNYNSIREQAFEANGDITLKCPTSYFAESYAERNNSVYYYLFTHRPSTTPWARWMGTVHFEEVQFVFGQPLREPFRYSREEFELSFKMVNIWAHFAKSGSPSLYFPWPKYSKKDHTLLILDTSCSGKLVVGPSLDNCNFLRSCYVF